MSDEHEMTLALARAVTSPEVRRLIEDDLRQRLAARIEEDVPEHIPGDHFSMGTWIATRRAVDIVRRSP